MTLGAAASSPAAKSRQGLPIISGFDPLFSLSGLAVGTIVGLTGVGGGSLMTPLLVLLFGVHPATAVGTDLMYAAATKSVGTFVHGKSDTVSWPIVGRLAAGSVPAAILTLLGMNALGLESGKVSSTIPFVLGIALLLTSVTLVFRTQIAAFAYRHSGGGSPGRTLFLTVFTGAVLGFLVSVSSVGAGALGVTALILLYPQQPTVRIVGSDIAHAVPLTLLAGLGHWMMGSVDWMMLGSLLVGSIPGIVIGSLLAPRLPDVVLRMSLAVVLVLVGTKLVLS